MRVNTPTFVQRTSGFRVSAHTFRYGIHFKGQRGCSVYRHLVVKVQRGHAFGAKNRRMLYVGWWETHHGTRRQLNGFRFTLALDKLPSYPNERHNVPFFPRRPRERALPWEAR